MLESFGPQFIVSVRPTTEVEMSRLLLTQSAKSTGDVINTMDSRGRAYSCQLPPAPEAPSATKTVAKEEQPAPVVDPREAVTTAVNALRGTCATKKTGWWTYEVCHFTETRQYHEENKKIDAVQNWSLGKVRSSLRTAVILCVRACVRAEEGWGCDESVKMCDRVAGVD
jgi:hypothetical protein